MKRTAENIKQLVQQELLMITNPTVKNELVSLLVPKPIAHTRDWDYGVADDTYECWTIAMDEKTDTSIVYSDFGFGPKTPWGLVPTNKLWIGADSGWFGNLMQCYLDSFSAGELPIWVVEKEVGAIRTVLTQNTKMDIAFNQRDTLMKEDSKGRYYVTYMLE
ncbi:hypothetical protein [Aquimarina rubra]|uniref:Uncharacterized protein n=1 Tax=Aquimarina rubra TaxID=1920033 RepID=A0ABW5LGC4_9FLAO